MRTFELYVRTEDDAFQPNSGPEVARILREIASRIETDGCPPWYSTILDANGNDVGRYAEKEK